MVYTQLPLRDIIKAKKKARKEVCGMSEREMAVSLLEKVPDYKMGYVLAYLQGITADEAADDAFCEEMFQNYLKDTDPKKDETYSLETCKKEWGID